MDEHGDHFQAWASGQDPQVWAGSREGQAVQHTEEQWEAIARHVRHAANKLGPDLPLCLPGEPRACGRTAQQHALTWAAELKARAHHLIEEHAPSLLHAAYFTGPHYQTRLEHLRLT
ncbi:hypothetical protein BJP40_00020 [Streptomyces sp. CC53]|uniref:hypothetical protein n=1 Tax=Streptomyces sp. CC53 TaxID=1906740 RepID=UPI0008DDD75F|nr:hypothetical protein [Streptomyces sp. CC53]OII64293.1 hypothetical protein BJP40_00020 [Streptomyces sp. CC53]